MPVAAGPLLPLSPRRTALTTQKKAQESTKLVL